MSTLLKSMFCLLLSTRRRPSCFRSCFTPWCRSVLGVVGGVGGPWGCPEKKISEINKTFKLNLNHLKGIYISLKLFWNKTQRLIVLDRLFHILNVTTCLHVQGGGAHQSSLPVLPSLVLLYTCDVPVPLLSLSRSGLVSHSSVAEVGTCSLDGLSCAGPEASLLHLQTASFHSLRANYGEKKYMKCQNVFSQTKQK